ncbi:MAG: MarR family winged helix-turn-helix transcriptional regulator [Emergencia sp.]
MLDQELHYLLMRAYHHSNRKIVQQITGHGMYPGQPKILEYLLEHDGCFARDICRGCVLDKSTMTDLLRRMESQGLIRRSAGADDRRTSHIHMTEKGRSAILQLKESFRTIDEKAFQGIGKKERAQFLETLKAITANLEEDGR